MNFGHDNIKPVIDAIIDLAESCKKEPRDLPEEPAEIDDINKMLKRFIARALKLLIRLLISRSVRLL